MNTEERLAKAEELLRDIICNTETNTKVVVTEIEEFLNPKPEVDWSQVPPGTVILKNEVKYIFGQQSPVSEGNLHTVNEICLAKDQYTIPPQPSHIHKCPWPEDGKKPDWVKDDDFILRADQIVDYYRIHNLRSPVKARDAQWTKPSKWFAILRVAEYWK